MIFYYMTIIINPIEILKQKKNTKYHTVRTAPQSYREIDLKKKKKKSTPSGQFQNTIDKSQNDAK